MSYHFKTNSLKPMIFIRAHLKRKIPASRKKLQSNKNWQTMRSNNLVKLNDFINQVALGNLADWLADFNGMSTCPGLFYV